MLCMQPEAVGMARVAVLVLLACLACTTTVSAQGSDIDISGSGSGSGEVSKDDTMVDQEPEEEAEYLVQYVEDDEFDLCDRYPYGEMMSNYS